MPTKTVERCAVIATAGVRLVVEVCYKCQCVFAMPESLYKRAREDSDAGFCCPNGHYQGYGETLREKLAQQRAAAAQAANRAELWRLRHDTAKRSTAATKGHMTRLKKRVAAGVCPCCNRTFRDLTRHMKSKHPDYGEGTPC